MRERGYYAIVIHSFVKEFDPYGYRDCMELGETEEDMIAKIYDQIAEDPNKFDAVAEIIDAYEDYKEQVYEKLIEAMQ